MSEKNEEKIKNVEYKDTRNIGYDTQIDDSRKKSISGNFISIFRKHIFSSGPTFISVDVHVDDNLTLTIL